MNAIDLNLLVALDVLLSAGSVSGAAQRMHLSAPAMSHTLARIRHALGDPILVRSGRRLVPTARAEALREPVRRLVADAQALMQVHASVALQRVRREFRVRAPEGMGVVYGAGLLAALREHMPQASLRFIPESDSDALALREGRIDLDVGTLADRGPETRTALLYEQALVGVVRAGHALLQARVTARRFAAHEHVAIAQRGGAPTPLDGQLAAAGCQRRIALTVPSAYGALMAAARSALVACVPEPLARTVGETLGLVSFKLPFALPAEQVFQAWHPRDETDPAHQCLRQCVATVPRDTKLGPLAGARVLSAVRQRELAAHRALLT
ncbi:LysR family transcriptional regulator [Aquabacterium sp.]|uniref:LysR family transcriptional regulator n=1 Tax=Aquabacterium sp. TaxID=1872578 RepID=UPI0037830822